MTLCPIAIVAGCQKCPALTICPLKGVLGDYQQPEEKQVKRPAKKTRGGTKKGR